MTKVVVAHARVLLVVARALGLPDERAPEMEPRDSASQRTYSLAAEIVAYAQVRLRRAEDPRPLSDMERAYCREQRWRHYLDPDLRDEAVAAAFEVVLGELAAEDR